MISEFSFPTKIIFGPGAVKSLGDHALRLGGSRVQIVADPGVVKAGLVDRIQLALKEAHLHGFVFDGVAPNPVEQNVLDGVAHYKESGCDVIVGIGGGSSMDAAKGIRLKSTHDLPLSEYTTDNEGWNKITPRVPPMISIPTTAGTGSEVGRGAVITFESTGRKALVFSPNLLADVALCDPELTLGLPPHITAWTGADALTHNVESFLSNVYHPICEGIAHQGVRLCFQHLLEAVANGSNVEARQGMMMAALMGGIAFQKDLGAIHSLAHPLSVHCGLNHGLANAVMLPHVLRFNLATGAENMALLARGIGEDTGTLSAEDAGQRFIARIEKLLREINIPPTLSELGVRAEDLERLVPDAFADPCHSYNPRSCTAEDMRRMYEEAM